jgi:hypothetical protein
MKSVGMLEAFLLLITFFLAGWIIPADGSDVRTGTVVTVNGEAVDKKNVEVSRNNVEKMFTHKYARAPLPQELTEALMTARKDKLVREIKDIIKKQAIAELGLKASKEEVDAELRKMSPDATETPEALLNRSRDLTSSLVKALRNVLKDPAKEAEIYSETMKVWMNHDQWLICVKLYNTEDIIKRIEKSCPKSTDAISKTLDDVASLAKETLETNKLHEWITRDVSVSASEISEEIKARQSKTPNEPVDKQSVRQDLLAEKQDVAESIWWENQFRKSKIEMDCQSFLELVRKASPTP